MFFTIRSLRLRAGPSLHDQLPGHSKKPFRKARFLRPFSSLDLSTEQLDLDSSCYSIPVSNVPSQYLASVAHVNGNTPRVLKLCWNQCESGTLIQPLKAHVWSQPQHLNSNTLNTEIGLAKDGRQQVIGIRFPARIIFQRHVLGGRLRRGLRAFSTNLRRHCPREVNEPVTGDEYLSTLSPSAPQRQKIRDHLRDWQRQHETLSATQPGAFETPITGIFGAIQNPISQSGADGTLNTVDQDDLALEYDLSPGDDHQLEPVESLSESVENSFYLRPGDVVELRSNDEPILAVFIRKWEDQSQFYTMTGNWVHRVDHHLSFVVPQLISADQLDPILPYLPSRPIPKTRLDHINVMDSSAPRGAGATIIAELNHFHRLAAEIILKNSYRLNQAFDIMAHPTDTTATTLNEIAMKVLRIKNPSQVTYPALWAVHKTIIRNENIYLVGPRDFPLIYVDSKKYAKDLVQIRTWVREYQEQTITNVTGIEFDLRDEDRKVNPLPGFVDKARALIAHSRKSRAVTKHGRIGPFIPEVRPTPLPICQFTSRELNLATFIRRLTCLRGKQSESYAYTILPTILRATAMYDGFELDKSTALVLLQEIGLLPSWMNKDFYNPILPAQMYDDIMRPVKDFKPAESFLDMTDSMAAFRKDWAGMPVFCIDSENTEDVDDGLSLEDIPGDPSSCWVHIHVANPSAFIEPSSRSGQIAERLVATTYLTHKRYPMLSDALTKDYFSLAKGRPCITFSAKVTSDADVTETKISHGIVQNVKFLTREQLVRELHPERAHAPSSVIVVGKRAARSRSTRDSTGQNLEINRGESLLPSDLKLLHKLSKIGTARLRRRVQAGAVYALERTQSSVSIDLTGNGHDPIISLTTQIRNPTVLSDPPAAGLVESLMIFAGEIAACWCMERNIPVSYVGTLRSPLSSESVKLYKQKFVDPVSDENGNAPFTIVARYLQLVGRSMQSPIPTKHIPLGVPYYCRVTSPLRRYGDLLAHWQIEAAIRREYATGSSLVGNTDHNYLPFSFSRLEALAPRIQWHERCVRALGNASEHHWKIQLLFRAFYFNEATLPSTFTLYMTHLKQSNQAFRYAWPLELGFTCEVAENEATLKEGGMMEGDVWEARIIHINCYVVEVAMEAIRLVSRGHRLLDWPIVPS